MRNQNQARMSAATTAMPTKIQRHGANSSTIWPKAGASTGAAMNTTNTRLITRAIARPEKQSRTNAIVTTRAPATAMPEAKRAASSNSKLPAIAASKLVATAASSATASTGRRPNRSASGPCASCATANPTRNAVMTNWRSLSRSTPSDSPIAGSAGSIESMPSAVSAISAAASATNSPKGIGA